MGVPNALLSVLVVYNDSVCKHLQPQDQKVTRRFEDTLSRIALAGLVICIASDFKVRDKCLSSSVHHVSLTKQLAPSLT